MGQQRDCAALALQAHMQTEQASQALTGSPKRHQGVACKTKKVRLFLGHLQGTHRVLAFDELLPKNV